jgi:DNA-binding CsgD family transcriptional regulator/PAS domain-containing protein
MSEARALSALLHTLYAAATQSDLWPNFLRELTQFLDLSAAAIVHQDCETGAGVIKAVWGLNPAGMKDYVEHYGALDEYRISVIKKHDFDFALAEEIVPKRQLSKTEFYNDFLERHGQILHCGLITSRTSKSFDNISLFSGIDQRPKRITLERLDLVLPHLKSAFQVQHRLFEVETRANDFVAALNSQRTGVILIDEVGGCFFVNRAAERFISRRDGLRLRNSRLFATLSQESDQLRSLIQSAITFGATKKPSNDRAMRITRSAGKPLHVQVTPISSESLNLPQRAFAMVVLSEPDNDPGLSTDALRNLYGLTPAEAKVAILLASGKSLEELCDELSIRYETARAHLKSIFGKVGVRRQGELVSRLLRSVVV